MGLELHIRGFCSVSHVLRRLSTLIQNSVSLFPLLITSFLAAMRSLLFHYATSCRWIVDVAKFHEHYYGHFGNFWTKTIREIGPVSAFFAICIDLDDQKARRAILMDIIDQKGVSVLHLSVRKR